jgi:glutathione S-transferase
MTLRLICTPRSHFSRKVRLLLDALGEPIELLDAGNVADDDARAFGPHPLMKVPTLLDGARAVFESDHIAAHVVRTRDPADRFEVLSTDADVLNARAVLNGIMATEVELVLAARTGLDTGHRRFGKMRAAIGQGLDWLETHHAVFGERPTYLGFHLLAMWDHLAFYDLVPLRQPRLRAIATALAALPYAPRSKPV